MMATPADYEDFAVCFSLSEGVIDGLSDIREIDVVETEAGIDLQIWLVDDKAERHVARRRAIAGPTGCGLCGIESLAEAVRPAVVVDSETRFSPEQITAALASLAPAQRLNAETRDVRSEEHTSELQSLMRISYAVFCLNKKKNKSTANQKTQ